MQKKSRSLSGVVGYSWKHSYRRSGVKWYVQESLEAPSFVSWNNLECIALTSFDNHRMFFAGHNEVLSPAVFFFLSLILFAWPASLIPQSRIFLAEGWAGVRGSAGLFWPTISGFFWRSNLRAILLAAVFAKMISTVAWNLSCLSFKKMDVSSSALKLSV